MPTFLWCLHVCTIYNDKQIPVSIVFCFHRNPVKPCPSHWSQDKSLIHPSKNPPRCLAHPLWCLQGPQASSHRAPSRAASAAAVAAAVPGGAAVGTCCEGSALARDAWSQVVAGYIGILQLDLSQVFILKWPSKANTANNFPKIEWARVPCFLPTSDCQTKRRKRNQ